MYNIWFNICGLAVSVITLTTYYLRNRIPIIQNSIFIWQIWCVILTTSCNLIMGIMQNNAHSGVDTGYLLFMNITALLYHTLRMVNALLYTYYVLVVLNLIEKSIIQFVYLYIPTIIAIGICLLGSFWNLVFYIDSGGIHHPGPLMPMLYIIALYYMLLIIYLTLRYRRMISLSRRIAFHSFGTLVMGTVIVERLYPTFMIEGFGSVLCQLLIYLTMQKPEEVVDGTTGLLNKISFFRMVSIRFKQKSPFDLIVIGIDNFAFLQKSLGLQVMGNLTVSIGEYLSGIAPKNTVYRVSDKIFCIMLNRKTQPYASALMEKLKTRYEAPWHDGDLTIHLTAHLALFGCPEEIHTIDDIVDIVDLVPLGTFKNTETGISGMSRHHVQDIEQALAAALRNQSLEIVYQPIYSASHNCFYSAEALLRLEDEKLGPVSPDEFIPIAEKSGLIVEIGKFVLEEVCRFITSHNLSELGLAYIEINMSIVECLQDNLVENIMETLKRNNVDTKLINFEITETAAETFPATVMHNINRLAEKGIRFSLDDYGSGYSNIGRILTMPLDIIKLDKTIIHSYFSTNTPHADIIMLETMGMLKKLEKVVVAEGVETKEQAERLILMGCEFLQGYYYAKPMPADAFLKALSSPAPV